jgi:3-mercaptopyruvate sulfurtransferase SseA
MKRTFLLASVAVLAAFAAPLTASAQTLPAIFAGNEPGEGIYVDQDYLNSLSPDESLKIIDFRSPEAYAAGHIDGAINIPNTVLSPKLAGLRNQLPSIEERQATFAAAGLSYDDTIIIYGDDLAGRAFIAFDQSGFDKVHILEGGITEWAGEASTEIVTPVASDFVLDRAKIEVVDKDYVLAHYKAPGTIIIDSRGAEGFAAGSIPGSINIPIGVSHSGAAVQNIEALAAALEANKVTPEHQLILTCGSGNVASNQLAALRDLGYTNLVLYDGSWEEWGNDPSTPKTGTKAG